jgi:DNA-binding CsgD family transcriptional regulator
MNLQLIRTSPAITDRQRQIVALIAAGCSNQEVGRHLGISARTVKAHCDTLRRKLGVDRRRQIPGAYYRLTGNNPFMRTLSDPILQGG